MAQCVRFYVRPIGALHVRENIKTLRKSTLKTYAKRFLG